MKTSAEWDFMDVEEIAYHVTCPDSIFLVDERDGPAGVIGFALASTRDLDGHKAACLIYLAVGATLRGTGAGKGLYDAMVGSMRARGVTSVYAWGSGSPGSRIQEFLARRKYRAGGTYVWMNTEL